jgi:hypothetical protein
MENVMYDKCVVIPKFFFVIFLSGFFCPLIFNVPQWLLIMSSDEHLALLDITHSIDTLLTADLD